MNNPKRASTALAAVTCLSAWGVMTYASIDPRLVATVLGIVAVAAYFYHQQSARELPEKRPRFAWMPKYRCHCTVPDSMRSSSDPARALVLRLTDRGFACDRQTPVALHLTRGHAKGDFSVELAKINLTFSLPIEVQTELVVEADWVAAFDTGDLWQLTTELKALVEAESPSESRAVHHAA